MGWVRNWTKDWTDMWASGWMPGGDIVPKFGLSAWYDFTNSAYLTLSATAITQALDRSGNGNNTAVQGTGTARPTYTTNQLNGLPLAVFDGGDFLALPAALYSIPNGNNTIFAVAKRNTETGSQEQVMTFIRPGAGTMALQYLATSGDIMYYNEVNGATAPTNSGNTNTNYQILTAFRSGTTQSISVNGDAAASNTNAVSNASTNTAFLGSSQGIIFLTGGIAEILIYNRALTAAEIAQVNRYLSSKYAITIA